MRAVLVTEFGPPHVLVPDDLPDPVPAAGQVLVRVSFANITFVDTQIRAGRSPGPASGLTPPFVPGNGVGGVIAAVGPDVDPEIIGHRVITTTGGSGGYADTVVVADSLPIQVPGEVPLDAAVALMADGRTALALIKAARLKKRDRVLIEAAAGGVGTLLTQLARRAGATVVAAAGGDGKLTLAAELGADITVDYRVQDWDEAVRGAVGGIDVVFDGVGGEIGATAYDLIDPGGRMFTYGLAAGPLPELDETDREVKITRGITLSPEKLRDLTSAALDSGLRPVIGQRFALADAAKAHAAIEARTTVGKTLLVVD